MIPENVLRAKKLNDEILRRPKTAVLGAPQVPPTTRSQMPHHEVVEQDQQLVYAEDNVLMENEGSDMDAIGNGRFSTTHNPLTTPLTPPPTSSNAPADAQQTPQVRSEASRKRTRASEVLIESMRSFNAQPPPTDYMPALIMMLQQSQQQMVQSNREMMVLFATLLGNRGNVNQTQNEPFPNHTSDQRQL